MAFDYEITHYIGPKMAYRKRKFAPGECMHIYQRTIKGHNIFYDPEDFLVFYSIFSTIARQYNIMILELCMMTDHIHILISASSLSQISLFIQHYTSLFVREYNYSINRRGSLFHKSFGSAPKKGSKKIRSTIVYIGNNPVEKRLCRYAEEYKWNFLSHMKDDGGSIIYTMSRKLKTALKEIRGYRNCSKYLNFAQVRRMLKGLAPIERDMLIDSVIDIYSPFDRDALLSFYDSYEDMLHAMRSSSGSEYDIKEKFNPGSDRIYEDMASEVRRLYPGIPVRKVTTMTVEQKIETGRVLQRNTGASIHQIAKFLHLELKRDT